MQNFRIEQICKYTSIPWCDWDNFFYKLKSNKKKTNRKFKLNLIEWDRQLPIILMFYALINVSSIDRGKKTVQMQMYPFTALYTIQHTKNKKVIRPSTIFVPTYVRMHQNFDIHSASSFMWIWLSSFLLVHSFWP